jgi:hypothetical protein
LASAAFNTRVAATAPQAIGVLPQHLLPNLSAMLAVATVAYCLFLFGAGQEIPGGTSATAKRF